MQQDVAAAVAGGLEGRFDEVHETDVNDRQFQLNVTKVPGGILVLAVVGGADKSGLDYTHVRIHETLLVGVTVVLVRVCGFHLDSGHLADFNWVHQTETNLSDSLWDHCALSAHFRSSSSRRMATPKLFISSRSSLKA